MSKTTSSPLVASIPTEYANELLRKFLKTSDREHVLKFLSRDDIDLTVNIEVPEADRCLRHMSDGHIIGFRTSKIRTLFHQLVYLGWEEEIEAAIKILEKKNISVNLIDGDGVTPFYYALITQKNLEIARKLYDAGAEISSKVESAYIPAAVNNVEGMKFVISKLPPEKVKEYLYKGDSHEDGPLLIAAAHNSTDCLEYLISINSEYTDVVLGNNLKVLAIAASKGSVESIRILKKYDVGIDSFREKINASNPLDAAIRANQFASVKVLLDLGCEWDYELGGRLPNSSELITYPRMGSIIRAYFSSQIEIAEYIANRVGCDLDEVVKVIINVTRPYISELQVDCGPCLILLSKSGSKEASYQLHKLYKNGNIKMTEAEALVYLKDAVSKNHPEAIKDYLSTLVGKAKLSTEEIEQLKLIADKGNDDAKVVYSKFLLSKQKYSEAIKYIDKDNPRYKLVEAKAIKDYLSTLAGKAKLSKEEIEKLKLIADKGNDDAKVVYSKFLLSKQKYSEAIKYMDKDNPDHKLVEVLMKVGVELPYSLAQIKLKFAQFKSQMDRELTQRTFSDDFIRTFDFIKMIAGKDTDFFSEAEKSFIEKVEFLRLTFVKFNEVIESIGKYSAVVGNPTGKGNPKRKEELEKTLNELEKVFEGKDYPEVEGMIYAIKEKITTINYRISKPNSHKISVENGSVFKIVEVAKAKSKSAAIDVEAKYDLSFETLSKYSDASVGGSLRAKIIKQLGIVSEVDTKMQLALEAYVDINKHDTSAAERTIRMAVKKGVTQSLIFKVLEMESPSILKAIREIAETIREDDDVHSVASSLRVKILGKDDTKDEDEAEIGGEFDVGDLHDFDCYEEAESPMVAPGPPAGGLRRGISEVDSNLPDIISEGSLSVLRTIFQNSNVFRDNMEPIKKLCEELNFQFQETKSGYLILNPETMARAAEAGIDPMHYGASMHRAHGTTYDGLHWDFVDNLHRIFKKAAQKFCPDVPGLEDVSEITEYDRQVVLERVMKGSFDKKDAATLIDIIQRKGSVSEKAINDIKDGSINIDDLRGLLVGMEIIPRFDEEATRAEILRAIGHSSGTPGDFPIADVGVHMDNSACGASTFLAGQTIELNDN